jgi:hypothetical protein
MCFNDEEGEDEGDKSVMQRGILVCVVAAVCGPWHDEAVTFIRVCLTVTLSDGA